MNRQEEILTILQEECAEVIQAISKIKRFGLENNVLSFKKELADVCCMINLLETYKVIVYEQDEFPRMIQEKQEKLKIYSSIFNE